MGCSGRRRRSGIADAHDDGYDGAQGGGTDARDHVGDAPRPFLPHLMADGAFRPVRIGAPRSANVGATDGRLSPVAATAPGGAATNEPVERLFQVMAMAPFTFRVASRDQFSLAGRRAAPPGARRAPHRR